MSVEELTVASACSQLAQAGLAASSLYASPEWLRVFDDPSTARTSVVVHRTDGVLDGALARHHMPDGSANSVYDLFAVTRGWFSGSPDDWRPQTLLGARIGQWNDVPTAGGAAGGEDGAVLARLLEAAAPDGPSALLYAGEGLARRVVAADPRFVPVLAEVGCAIDLTCEDFDGYVAGLSSSRRGTVRRELRDLSGNLRARYLGPDAPELEHYAELAVHVQERHGQPASRDRMTTYLRRCASAGLPTVAFELVDGSGAVTAFALGIEYGGTLWMRLVGLTYDEVGGTGGAYGQVLVYEPVRHALRNGLRTVDLGAGVSHAKRLRGAAAVPLWHLVRPPDGVALTVDLDGRTRDRALELGIDHVTRLGTTPAPDHPTPLEVRS